MPYMMVHHNVKDYDTWKIAFDEHSETRKAAGSKGGHLFRGDDNPNEVIAVLEFEDLDKAREFANSDNLREVMQNAGVEGPPTIVFMNAVDRPSA